MDSPFKYNNRRNKAKYTSIRRAVPYEKRHPNSLGKSHAPLWTIEGTGFMLCLTKQEISPEGVSCMTGKYAEKNLKLLGKGLYG
jgi:hypothetical protein